MYKGDILDLLVHYKNYHLLPPKKTTVLSTDVGMKNRISQRILVVQHTNPDMQLKFLS